MVESEHTEINKRSVKHSKTCQMRITEAPSTGEVHVRADMMTNAINEAIGNDDDIGFS